MIKTRLNGCKIRERRDGGERSLGRGSGEGGEGFLEGFSEGVEREGVIYLTSLARATVSTSPSVRAMCVVGQSGSWLRDKAR